MINTISKSLAKQHLLNAINHRYLLTTTKTENKVESRLLLNVVVGQGSAIFKLLASKDETLLVGRNAFLVLNLGLDVLNGVR
jgi:hypothetical protein